MDPQVAPAAGAPRLLTANVSVNVFRTPETPALPTVQPSQLPPAQGFAGIDKIKNDLDNMKKQFPGDEAGGDNKSCGSGKKDEDKDKTQNPLKALAEAKAFLDKVKNQFPKGGNGGKDGGSQKGGVSAERKGEERAGEGGSEEGGKEADERAKEMTKAVILNGNAAIEQLRQDVHWEGKRQDVEKAHEKAEEKTKVAEEEKKFADPREKQAKDAVDRLKAKTQDPHYRNVGRNINKLGNEMARDHIEGRPRDVGKFEQMVKEFGKKGEIQQLAEDAKNKVKFAKGDVAKAATKAAEADAAKKAAATKAAAIPKLFRNPVVGSAASGGAIGAVFEGVNQFSDIIGAATGPGGTLPTPGRVGGAVLATAGGLAKGIVAGGVTALGTAGGTVLTGGNPIAGAAIGFGAGAVVGVALDQLNAPVANWIQQQPWGKDIEFETSQKSLDQANMAKSDAQFSQQQLNKIDKTKLKGW